MAFPVENIRAACKAKGITLAELERTLNIGNGVIAKWETAKGSPPYAKLAEIADYLDISLDALAGNKKNTASDEAVRLAKKIERLNKEGRGAVTALIDYYETSKEVKMKSIPLFGQSMAAGFGEPDFGTDWFDAVDVPEDSKADFACRVHGDSLEPYYHDGDIALACKGIPQIGQIGAFYLDGEWILKQYCDDNYGNVYLFAVNRDCKSTDRILWHNEEHTLLCMGTLLDLRPPLPND